MALIVSWVKKLARSRVHKCRKLILPRPSLQASISSPAMPLEVVLAADLGCIKCQKRVADAMSRIDDVESMVVHVLEKKVTVNTREPITKGYSTKISSIYNNLTRKASRMA